MGHGRSCWVQHYPLSRHTLVGLAFPANSIWQVPDVWKDRRWRAAGRGVSLDIIEHEIIRPAFREPRTHFALVCAARSYDWTLNDRHGDKP